MRHCLLEATSTEEMPAYQHSTSNMRWCHSLGFKCLFPSCDAHASQGELDDVRYAAKYVESKWKQAAKGPAVLRQVRGHASAMHPGRQACRCCC